MIIQCLRQRLLRQRFSPVKNIGLAALEFVIMLPALLVMSVVMIDVGRFFIQYTEVNKALQLGARFAVVKTYGTSTFDAPADEASIKNMVVYGVETPLSGASPSLTYLDSNDIQVQYPSVGDKHVRLVANFSYQPIFAAIPFTNGSLNFEVAASTMMRAQR